MLATSDRWLPLEDRLMMHRIETSDPGTGNDMEDPGVNTMYWRAPWKTG